MGSQAHGLAVAGSDFDYREVFYVPTRELLSLPASARPKSTWGSPQSSVDDEGGWEVGHFLEMCLAGNPNVVEVLWAPDDPAAPTHPEGAELRELAPALLGTDPILRAFLGYAQNARLKIATDGVARVTKWTSTYLRVLYTARELFLRGTVSYPVTDYWWGEQLRRARAGELSGGEVAEGGPDLEEQVREDARRSVLRPVPDVDAVNDWLERFRRGHFDD